MKEYQKENCGTCPKCGSPNIEYGSSYPDDSNYCYEFKCKKCGCKGKEWYAMEYTETIGYK